MMAEPHVNPDPNATQAGEYAEAPFDPDATEAGEYAEGADQVEESGTIAGGLPFDGAGEESDATIAGVAAAGPVDEEADATIAQDLSDPAGGVEQTAAEPLPSKSRGSRFGNRSSGGKSTSSRSTGRTSRRSSRSSVAGQTMLSGRSTIGCSIPSVVVRECDVTFGESAPNAAVEFEISKQLGKGGMGLVYAARQSSIDRMIALKTLNSRHGRVQKKKDEFQFHNK